MGGTRNASTIKGRGIGTRVVRFRGERESAVVTTAFMRPQGVVLALDPGYRAGCKCAVVDKMGNVLETFVCYLHKETEMKKKIRDTCEQHKVSVVAIGGRTASRETRNARRECEFEHLRR